jgi:hypothetical protein
MRTIIKFIKKWWSEFGIGDSFIKTYMDLINGKYDNSYK